MKIQNPKPEIHKNNFHIGIILLIIFSMFIINNLLIQTRQKQIPYSEFIKLVDTDQIASVVFSESSLSGELKTTNPKQPVPFTTNLVPDPTLVPKLLARNIEFQSNTKSLFWNFFATWLIPIAIFYWLSSFALRGINPGTGGILSMTKSQAKVFIEKDIQTSFADVAGIDEAKDELVEVVSFLQDPQRYSRLGGRAPKGILLVGPPGTGKTLLARALAGEAKVPFFSINGSEFVEMFVGLGAARVRDLFEQARSQAPCILFIDEIDALGKSRALGFMGSGSNDEKEQTLNQLLAEMDGFDTSVGVIMLAATNRPEILDPALLRAGRFDRQVLLGSPDQIGRLQVLRVHCKRIKTNEQLELAHIASLTAGFSGADIANLVNEAALVATRRGAEFVMEADFTQAVERLVAGLEKKSRVMNPQEKQRIAYHELGHATVALAQNCTDKVHKISIIPRGMGALGYTLQRPTEDRYVLDEAEILAKITVLLGGRAAENIFCGSPSTGAADDLAKATELARAMVTQFGMSEKLGMVALEIQHASFLQRPFEAAPKLLSEKMASAVDIEIKAIIEKCFQRATRCLQKNRAFIHASLEKLILAETLDGKEIAELWGQQGKALTLHRKVEALPVAG